MTFIIRLLAMMSVIKSLTWERNPRQRFQRRKPPPDKGRENAEVYDQQPHYGTRSRPGEEIAPATEECSHDPRHATKPGHRIQARPARDNVTIGILVFTAIYAVAFVYQMYIDERPYILAQPVSVDTWEIGKPSGIKMVLQNIGKAPAYKFGFRFVVYAAPPDKLVYWEPFTASYYDSARDMQLMQGQAITTELYATSPLAQDVKSGVESDPPKYRIVIETEADYVDAFWLPHTDRICDIWNKKLNGFAPCVENPQPKHNSKKES